ncbi:MAG: VOC family protein [Terriglobia bacterium]
MLTGLDHLILGIDDLDRGVAWMDRVTGVRAVFGGVHPGRGTQNALLALGPNCYLEIMAPDPEQPSVAWFTRMLTLSEPRLMGWAVHTSDVFALAQAARLAGIPIDGPHDGARSRPGGAILSWKLFRLWDDRGGLLPIFLDWGESVHPAQDAPPGCHLERFHLQSPEAGELARVFHTLCVDVLVEPAREPRMLARIKSPRGEVELTS